MSRSSLRELKQLPLGGINQEVDRAPSNTCADARNVWAPKGKIETRPGFIGASSMLDAGTGQNMKSSWYDTSGGTYTSSTTTLNINSMEIGDVLYIGHTAAWNGCGIDIDADNDAATQAKWEYYNGTEWLHLRVNMQSGNLFDFPNVAAGTGVYRLSFAEPKDWATVSVDSVTAYWIRGTLVNANIGSCTIDVQSASGTIINNQSIPVAYKQAQFPSGPRYIGMNVKEGTGSYGINSGVFSLLDAETDYASDTSISSLTEPATIAIVPQFGEGFLAYGGKIKRFSDSYNANSTPFTDAAVERSEAIVGTGTDYDKAYIAQKEFFPKGRYITYFAGRLWISGIEGEPYTVRWSAASPYHTVWPEISFEYLMEDDNSPITGQYPLGEHMVIFKQDSIWIMVDSGVDEFGLTRFIPKKMVSGVGCVAQSSIQPVRGKLIFLSEDGLYSFDGVREHKISLHYDKFSGEITDRLQDTFDDINDGKRVFCASANWRSKSCYLLSVSTSNEESNDLTIVWNYNKDRFWLWDSIDARIWGVFEGDSDEERMYFVDSENNIWLFGVGKLDGGNAIDGYFVTQRTGQEDDVKRRVRRVSVNGTNTVTSIDVEVLPDDKSSGTTGTIDFSESDIEKSYGSGTFGTDSWVNEQRRKRSIGFREDSQWWQLKIRNNNSNERMKVSSVATKILELGVR